MAVALACAMASAAADNATLQTAGGDNPAKPPAPIDGKPYSLPTAPSIPTRALWGNTHQHTSTSFDAGFFGTRLGPEDAFRFARGEQVISNTGIPAKLDRPYDFLVVTDHSDYLGLADALKEGTPELLSNPIGQKWYDDYHNKNGGSRSELMTATFKDMVSGKPTLVDPAVNKSGWERSVAAAEKYNDPGHFTAFIGFEWSPNPDGNNLHRNVIFRDGGKQASQVVPFTSLESQDPEKLWQFLSDYQQKTGGQVLAIPHNSNLSGGQMFSDKTFGGQPFDRSYAEQRAKWEPLVEVTQTKGDSETDPSVSPDDEFADFERWDKANIIGTRLDTPEEQPYNYIRPTLTRGLKLEASLGVNPYKFGLVGGTDSHTGLVTVDANNYFGVMPGSEPGPQRLSGVPHLVLKSSKAGISDLDMSSAGISGVWAVENTRESIFDAFRRKEVYGTTGPRITVRVFAGWDLKPGDLQRSDFAEYGYAHGVPMGGDLSGAKPGRKPTFLIRTAKDPEGANLDRVQVIKGWLDASGQTHEKIFDVAWSGKRRLGQNGKLPPVGNTVDVATANYSNSIGAPTLDVVWTDPHFDPAQRAYYYLRVIEIPTPRWSTYDAVRFGVTLPSRVPATETQRAYTSPIWYIPNAGA
jgi:hypothetical protein